MRHLLLILAFLPTALACANQPPGTHLAILREGQLVLLTADGKPLHTLLKDLPSETPIEWSPDGRQIVVAILDPKTGVQDLVSLDPNQPQAPPKNLTRLKEGVARSPAFSPDSAHIAWMAEKPAGLVVIDRDGGNPRRLTTEGQPDFKPAWSPDGKSIIYGEFIFVDESSVEKFRLELMSVNPSGHDVRRLTAAEGSTDSPAFSPKDPSRLLYRGARAGNSEICLLDLAARKELNLTRSKQDERDPRWSPDAKRVAFWRREKDQDQLWTIDPDGASPKLLAEVPHAQHPTPPAWSPDGRHIAYGTTNGVHTIDTVAPKPTPTLINQGPATQVLWRD